MRGNGVGVGIGVGIGVRIDFGVGIDIGIGGWVVCLNRNSPFHRRVHLSMARPSSC